MRGGQARCWGSLESTAGLSEGFLTGFGLTIRSGDGWDSGIRGWALGLAQAAAFFFSSIQGRGWLR